MNPTDYVRLKDIVSGALSRPAAERPASVLAQCGADVAARLEVESVLAAATRAAPLYEDPTLLIGGAGITFEALHHAGDITLPFAPPPARLLLDTAGHDHFQGTERYVVRRQIGAGGMGIVYEVDDRARGQVVALKTLRRRRGDEIYQFKREFRNLADVAHPNLAALYDLVVDDEQCFFTMELVEGTTFVDHVRQGASPTTIAERIRAALPQLVDAVHELHRRGLQHRDIKPSNVLVTSAGRVVVLDFGLTSGPFRDDPGRDLAGTPAYLSPEQCLGGAVSNASDWYSVGATLYHALTGRVPFDGSVRDVIERKTIEDPPRASDLVRDIPADLDDICMALLHRNPGARITGREVLARLSVTQWEAISGNGDVDDAVFVGRQSSLDVLSDAFADVTSGRSISVCIYGPSGIGKSALVQHFLDTRVEGQPALVLRSRCHEHESDRKSVV